MDKIKKIISMIDFDTFIIGCVIILVVYMFAIGQFKLKILIDIRDNNTHAAHVVYDENQPICTPVNPFENAVCYSEEEDKPNLEQGEEDINIPSYQDGYCEDK
jgi:hypothetical protein